MTAFSILDALEGRGNPEDTVVLYANKEYAYRIQKIREQISEVFDVETLDELESELDAAQQALKDSGITFTIRAVDTAVIRDVYKKHDKDFLKANYEILSLAIVKAETSEGQVDNNITPEKVEFLANELLDSEFNKLQDTHHKLTASTGEFVNADF